MRRRLSPTENKIIELRLTGNSLFELSEDDMRYAIDQIMLRGAAITGAPLPQTEFFATFIFSELTIFLLEMGYAELTLAEILFALRLNSAGKMKYSDGDSVKVEFRGNCFNVDFVSNVLSAYMSMRNSVDRKLQNQIDGF